MIHKNNYETCIKYIGQILDIQKHIYTHTCDIHLSLINIKEKHKTNICCSYIIKYETKIFF